MGHGVSSTNWQDRRRRIMMVTITCWKTWRQFSASWFFESVLVDCSKCRNTNYNWYTHSLLGKTTTWWMLRWRRDGKSTVQNDECEWICGNEQCCPFSQFAQFFCFAQFINRTILILISECLGIYFLLNCNLEAFWRYFARKKHAVIRWIVGNSMFSWHFTRYFSSF